MLTRRNWVLRFSIVLNLVVLFYFGTHIASKNGGMDIIEELQQSGRELAAMEEEMAQEGGRRLNGVQSMPSAAALVVHTSPQQGTTSQSVSDKRQTRLSTTAASTTERKETSSGGSGGGGGGGTVSALPQSEATLQMLIPCHDRDALPFTGQRGDFWVLYNYVAAARRPRCWESVTYTTHADYTFLDNLQPLLDRWRGPVSLALYAPGTDFAQTLNTIRYLKDCGSDLVNEFVTFHIYFPSKHIPKQIPRGDAILAEPGSTNCSLPPPWLNQTAGALYKTRKKLLYPVNVGRNIARESATTHFVLPSDIELYPSPGLIPEFLAMVLRQEPPLLRKNPKVFVLSIFELESNMHLPVNKNELVSMVRNGSAISFHKKVCPGCHNVPKSKEWLNTAPSASAQMRVFHIGKRTGYFVHWEPIFIGTNHDPFYDERLSWEGKSDKMTQGYTLCVLDYEFHILDSAFLVHKPGIKTLKKDPARAALSAKSNALISRVIFPELKVLYGTRRGCAV